MISTTMPKPDFFIVGAPKCGTTALFRYLQEHPDIYLPKKEFHHFGSDLRPAGFAGYQGDRAAYLKLFDGATTEKRIGEASVWYLYSQNAACEIKTFAPEADIIIALRNPVEMIYSLYSFFIWARDFTPNGVIDAETRRVLSFEEALRTQDARKEALRHTLDEAALAGKRVRRLFHTDAAMYADQVRRYLDVFGREQMHVVLFDDLETDAAGVYRRLLQALGVDPTYRADFRVVNSNRHVRNVRLHRLLHDHASMGLLRSVARAVAPVRLRKRVFRLLQHSNVQHRPRPPMKPETRRALQEMFRPDVENLSALLDQDLVACWL
jgi:hypothetical protein